MDAQIFVEYVMLNQVNDAPETAHELGQLLRGKNMILNLIPWNPIYSPDMHFEAPGGTRVAAFQRIVREDYGVFCTVRQEMGQDISGNLLCPTHSFAAVSQTVDVQLPACKADLQLERLLACLSQAAISRASGIPDIPSAWAAWHTGSWHQCTPSLEFEFY